MQTELKKEESGLVVHERWKTQRDQRQGILPRVPEAAGACKGDESQTSGISSGNERGDQYKRNFKGKIDGA